MLRSVINLCWFTSQMFHSNNVVVDCSDYSRLFQRDVPLYFNEFIAVRQYGTALTLSVCRSLTRTIYPELKEQLKELRKHLVESTNDMAPLKVWQMQGGSLLPNHILLQCLFFFFFLLLHGWICRSKQSM